MPFNDEKFGLELRRSVSLNRFSFQTFDMPPLPPPGFYYLIDNGGNYLIDNDGNYLTQVNT